MQPISKAELNAQKALIRSCCEAGVGIEGLEGMERFSFVPPPSTARDREAVSEYAKPSKRSSYRPKCRNPRCICHKSRWFKHCALVSGTGDYHIPMRGDDAALDKARKEYSEGRPKPLRKWLADTAANRRAAWSAIDGAGRKSHRGTMTPTQFKSIRVRADLTQSELADFLRISDRRSIRYWETGERQISGPVSYLMELLDSGVISARKA
jgi:DNA-binding XRE family transcriptional regulator